MAVVRPAERLTFLPPGKQVAWGTWALGGGRDWGVTDPDEAADVLCAALDSGAKLFDTSPIYGAGCAEEWVGRAVQGRRSEVIIASKCGISLRDGRPDHDLRPASIMADCENSLRRLRTDYIDIYQIHWPDSKVPLADSLGALVRLQEQGKIRAIGVCNFSLVQLQEALQVASVSTVQGPFSLLDTSSQTIAQYCARQGLFFWAYGALGGGILSGKYKQAPNLRRCDARRYFYKYYIGENFAQASAVAARVKQVAQEKHVPASAVALAWVLGCSGVNAVIAGVRSRMQVAENRLASQIKLTELEKEFLYAGLS